MDQFVDPGRDSPPSDVPARAPGGASRWSRVRPWLRRYGPCEVLGTAGAFLSSWIALQCSGGSLAAAAWAGTAGGTIGFYALPAVRAFRQFHRVGRSRGALARALVTSAYTARSLLAEFGPAELVDSALLRPSLLYLGPLLLGNPWWGWLAGKVVADAVFYLITAIAFRQNRAVIERLPTALSSSAG